MIEGWMHGLIHDPRVSRWDRGRRSSYATYFAEATKDKRASLPFEATPFLLQLADGLPAAPERIG
jgi:hypothetical protein